MNLGRATNLRSSGTIPRLCDRQRSVRTQNSQLVDVGYAGRFWGYPDVARAPHAQVTSALGIAAGRVLRRAGTAPRASPSRSPCPYGSSHRAGPTIGARKRKQLFAHNRSDGMETA